MRQHRAISWLVLLGAVAGCDGGEFGAREVARGTWALEADERRALVDRRCQGAECARYPNPDECDRLDVDVFPDGRVCGRCGREGGAVERCGGPAQGLPYRCFLEADDAGLACVACDDLFGQRVYRECAIPPGGAREPAPGAVDPTEDDSGRCFDLRRADGTPCSVCLGEDARVASDDCEPTDDPVLNEESRPAPEEQVQAEPADQACPADRDAALLLGRQRFADALNGILAEAGLAADYAVDPDDPVLGEDERYGEWSEWEEVRVGELCGAYGDVDELRDPDEDRDEGWLREGELRCGYVIQSAAVRACGTLGECNTDGIDSGLSSEMGKASIFLEGRYECTGSPIVLDLDGDGVESIAGGARFDLGAIGRAVRTAWIRQGDALLAIDRDGDGRIGTGVELFGEVTPGARGLSGDGFSALAALDSDQDGALTPADSAFDRLLVWRDDGDGRSTAPELKSIVQAGITRLDLGAVPVAARDAAGSIPALWSRFTRSDGSTGLLCDVFFAATPE